MELLYLQLHVMYWFDYTVSVLLLVHRSIYIKKFIWGKGKII